MSETKKKRPLKPAHERFAAEVASGKSATRAAMAAYPNQTLEAAAVTASRLLRNAKVQARIEERIQEATDLTGNEVIGTLASQMRGDITDVLREDGSLDLVKVRSERLGHLIKRITIRQESAEVVGVENAGEDGEEVAPIVKRVDIIAVEFHSQQTAAIQLCKVFGLEQQARENDRDATLRQRVAKAIERLAKSHYKGNVLRARRAYVKAVPEHLKYVM